jgi:hypothetical protein
LALAGVSGAYIIYKCIFSKIHFPHKVCHFTILLLSFQTPSGTKCTASVKVTGNLDYEKQNSYELTIRVKDAGGLECTMTVKVIVRDKNDKPTVRLDILATNSKFT